MAFYGKVFVVESEENIEPFVKSMGFPEERSQQIMQYKPSQKVEKNGDEYIFKVFTDKGEKIYTSKSGVEFSDTFRDLPVKITITADGDNKFTQVIKFDVGLALTIKKEFSSDTLKEEISHTLWDGVARKVYKAQ